MRLGFLGAIAAAALLAGPAALASDDDIIVLAPDALVITADETGRVTAPVYINGQGPFEFIVDTGANRSAVSSTLAQSLALPLRGEADVHALTGVFRAPMAEVDHFHAGTLDLRATLLPVIDGGVLGEAQGVLGVQSMDGRRLIVDFEHRQLMVSNASERLPDRRWRTSPARVHFGGLVDVPGAIGGIHMRVILDTGSSNSFVNVPLRDALRRISRSNEALVSWHTLNIYAPTVATSAVYLPEMTLGGATIRGVHAGVADMYAFDLWGLGDEPAMVLGADALRQVRALAIDYDRSTVHMLR